ncbi:MAG TPA: hypothetical protein VJ302_27490 [Blastocatellia bacterium]|nr:hypothetical protein [Blastocatellia bacterium]
MDETINRIAHKIAMGHGIEDLIKFSHGVARLVLMEHWNDPGREWEQLDDQFLSSEEDPEFDDPELTCMQKCLQSLSPEDQYLIVQNFTLDKRGKEELARAQGLSINAFRLRVFRIKTKLYECRRRCARKR